MALNIAVPLSGVGDIFGENFSLMSPMASESPNFDCRTTTKVLCSPIDSESSGISSLDSEEIKKSSVSSSPTDDEHASSDQGGTTPSLITTSESSDPSSHLLSPKPKHATAITTETIENKPTKDVSKTDENVDGSDDDVTQEEKHHETNENFTESYYSIAEQEKLISKLRIEINGRNILDLGTNLNPTNNNNTTTNGVWQQQNFMRYAYLPENNLKMFLENRSQYHRLGANGHTQEFALVNCKCCDFIYPVNGYNNSGNTSVKTNMNGQVASNDGNNNNNNNKNNLIGSVIANVRINEPPVFNTGRPAQQQQQQFQPNYDYNNFTALNRSVINNNQSNIFENIAAALLNTTTNMHNNNNNNGLNHQTHYTNNNKTHHYHNNNNNNRFGANNYAYPYTYKQF